jgi:hypothetical protein
VQCELLHAFPFHECCNLVYYRYAHAASCLLAKKLFARVNLSVVKSVVASTSFRVTVPNISCQLYAVCTTKNVLFIIYILLSIGRCLFFQKLRRGGFDETFQRFFGLPRLRTPCGRLSLAIFARRLSSILPTWASHSLLQTSVHSILLNST